MPYLVVVSKNFEKSLSDLLKKKKIKYEIAEVLEGSRFAIYVGAYEIPKIIKLIKQAKRPSPKKKIIEKAKELVEKTKPSPTKGIPEKLQKT